MQQEQRVTIQPPTTPGGPVIVTQTPVTSGVPQTRAEYRALILKRQELSDQLAVATSRRRDIAERLDRNPSDRAGLSEAYRTLEVRIARLESEIDRAGDQIANVPPSLLTAETVQNPRLNLDEDIVVPVVGMLSVFVLLPLSIGLARLIWKRAAGPSRPAIPDHAAQQRLEQIQQSIDAIAIEVERISEGQRFVSKMLSDRNSHGIGAGAADPLRASLKAAIPSERG